MAMSARRPPVSHLQAQLGDQRSRYSVAFGVYALALLVSLLTFGRISDFVGRKPVVWGAIAVQLVAIVAFLMARCVQCAASADPRAAPDRGRHSHRSFRRSDATIGVEANAAGASG